MTDKSIQEFLNELSSISPLTSEYEASMVTLNIYINLIKKNTISSISRNNSDLLEQFLLILDKNISNITYKYNASANYIKNYLLIMKMPKSSSVQISEYKSKLQEITIDKLNSYIDVLSYINQVLNSYVKYKELYKEECISSNNLCISNITNIQFFLKELVNNACLDIDDESVALNIINKLNGI